MDKILVCKNRLFILQGITCTWIVSSVIRLSVCPHVRPSSDAFSPGRVHLLIFVFLFFRISRNQLETIVSFYLENLKALKFQWIKIRLHGQKNVLPSGVEPTACSAAMCLYRGQLRAPQPTERFTAKYGLNSELCQTVTKAVDILCRHQVWYTSVRSSRRTVYNFNVLNVR